MVRKHRGAPSAAASRSSPILSQSSSQHHSEVVEDSANAESYVSKFKHLLEPIRDLAENWNVDIARDLEVYLNDLELLEISLDGGATTLNFAEAALLIQGSTCVYSRKVEYLHQLVFHVLEVLSDSQQQQAKANKAAENADGEDPEEDFPREPEFIELDDIPEAKSSQIDLAEKDDDDDDEEEHNNKNAEHGSAGAAFNRSPQLLLMALEADPDSTDPNKDLQLRSAVMHPSGALLLDAKHQHLLDNALQPLPARGRPPHPAGLRTPLLLTSPRSSRSRLSSIEAIRADAASPSSAAHAGAGADAAASPLRMILEFEPEQGAHSDGGGGDDDDDDNVETHEVEEGAGTEGEDRAGPEAEQEEEQVQVDPWAMLDPHDASASRERPLRRGRTHRRPRVPADGTSPSTALRAGGGVGGGGRGGGGDEIWAHQRRSLLLPYFEDMSGAFAAERSRVLAARMAAARAQGRGRAGGGRGGSGGAGLGARAAEGVHFHGIDMEDGYDEADAGGYDAGGGGEGGGDSDDDDNDDGPPPMTMMDDAEVNVVDTGELGGGGGRGWGSGAGVGGEWAAGASYEELCRARVEECMRGVEAFLGESGLDARVRAWRARMEPRLDAEAARPAFDIHHYGTEVKRRLSAAGGVGAGAGAGRLGFAEAVSGMSQPDVCRAFLAALQLANDGNLDIHLRDPSDRSSVELELLESDASTHAMLGAYVAPSILSAQKKKQHRLRSPATKRPRNARPGPSPARDAENLIETAGAGPSLAVTRLREASPLRPLNYAAEGGEGEGEGGGGQEELEVSITQCSQSLTQEMHEEGGAGPKAAAAGKGARRGGPRIKGAFAR